MFNVIAADPTSNTPPTKVRTWVSEFIDDAMGPKSEANTNLRMKFVEALNLEINTNLKDVTSDCFLKNDPDAHHHSMKKNMVGYWLAFAAQAGTCVANDFESLSALVHCHMTDCEESRTANMLPKVEEGPEPGQMHQDDADFTDENISVLFKAMEILKKKLNEEMKTSVRVLGRRVVARGQLQPYVCGWLERTRFSGSIVFYGSNNA